MGLRPTVAHICLLHFIKIRSSLAARLLEVMGPEIVCTFTLFLHTLTCVFPSGENGFIARCLSIQTAGKILSGFLGQSLQLSDLQY